MAFHTVSVCNTQSTELIAGNRHPATDMWMWMAGEVRVVEGSDIGDATSDAD